MLLVCLVREKVVAMGRGSKVAKPLFRMLVLVGLVWFCYAGISTSSDAETMKVRAQTSMHMQWKANQKPELLLRWDSRLRTVSKRRVPNGPDPIHNRRTVKSRQPPSRA